MCQEVECQRPAIARGLCHKHYQRARRRGEIQIESAYGAGLDFLRTLPETDDCIEWPFGRFTTGYGNVKVDGRNRTAHSVSYELPVHRPLKLVEARGTVRRVLHEEPADTRLQQTQVLNVGRVHMELVGQPLERDPRFQSEDLDPDDDAHRVQVDDDAVAELLGFRDLTARHGDVCGVGIVVDGEHEWGLSVRHVLSLHTTVRMSRGSVGGIPPPT